MSASPLHEPLVDELAEILSEPARIDVYSGCEHLLGLPVVRDYAAQHGVAPERSAQMLVRQAVDRACASAEGFGGRDVDRRDEALIVLRVLVGLEPAMAGKSQGHHAYAASLVGLSGKTLRRNRRDYAERLLVEFFRYVVGGPVSPQPVLGQNSVGFDAVEEAERAIESEHGLFLGQGQMQVRAAIFDQRAQLELGARRTLRVLLTAPDRAAAELAAERSGDKADEMLRVLWSSAEEWQSMDTTHTSGRLEVRFIRSLPPFAGLIRIGQSEVHVAWIRPSAWRTSRTESRPLLVLREDEQPVLYGFYRDDFESMWRSGRPLGFYR
ncbi:MAG: hypothetical protein AAGC53_05390 [Actinomycetota bacterium]